MKAIEYLKKSGRINEIAKIKECIGAVLTIDTTNKNWDHIGEEIKNVKDFKCLCIGVNKMDAGNRGWGNSEGQLQCSADDVGYWFSIDLDMITNIEQI